MEVMPAGSKWKVKPSPARDRVTTIQSLIVHCKAKCLSAMERGMEVMSAESKWKVKPPPARAKSNSRNIEA